MAFRIEQAAFIALLLLAITFSVEVLLFPITIGGQDFSNVEILEFIVIGLWFVARCIGPQETAGWRKLPFGLTTAVGLWLAALLVSTFLAPTNGSLALAFDGRIVRGLFLAWIAFDLTSDRERWQTVIRCLALGGIVVYAAGLAEVVKLAPFSGWLVGLRGSSIFAGGLLRLSSTLTYPNIAAVIIVLTLFPVLAWALITRRRWLRLVLGVAALSGLIALILTYSRGGLIAFLLSLLAVAAIALHYRVLDGRKRTILLGTGVVVGSLAIASAIFVLNNPSAMLRFITEDDQSWYRASFTVNDHVSARPGETVTIPVQITNAGPLTWQASGDQVTHLSYHLLRVFPDVRIGVQYEGERTALPNNVPPGKSVTVEATVIAPPQSGDYLIEWDMVQENVTWFSAKSAAIGNTRLTLDGEPVGDAIQFSGIPFNDVPPKLSPGRLALWKVALQMAQRQLLFGVGPDNFRQTYGQYLGGAQWSTDIHANNLYIEWLADTGIVGLLTFLLMSVMLARNVWASLKQQLTDPLFIWQLALIGSLLAWYIHGFVDYFYEFTPTNVAFWLIFGLALGPPTIVST